MYGQKSGFLYTNVTFNTEKLKYMRLGNKETLFSQLTMPCMFNDDKVTFEETD